MKIYVASSWKNKYQQDIVFALRMIGHTVYDFKNPVEGNNGFSWQSIDEQYKEWDNQKYIQALQSNKANEGFNLDEQALKECNCCIMVLPCGKSSHLELGYAIGKGKLSIILLEKDIKPESELMYKFAHLITDNFYEVIGILTNPR
jgi:hypothetical protein